MLLVEQSNDNTSNLRLAQTCLSSRIHDRSEKRRKNALMCLYSPLSSTTAAPKPRKKDQLLSHFILPFLHSDQTQSGSDCPRYPTQTLCLAEREAAGESGNTALSHRKKKGRIKGQSGRHIKDDFLKTFK